MSQSPTTSNSRSIQKTVWDQTWKDLIAKKDFFENSSYQRTWHSFLINIISSKVSFKKVTNALEVGCGDGIFGLEIANRYPNINLYLSDISSYAINYSKKLLENCKEVRKSENYLNIHPIYIVEDMFSLKHADNFFDFVINGGSLEHYSDNEIQLLVTEMLRVTNKGGYVTIAVPNLLNIDLLIVRLKRAIRSLTNNIIFKDMMIYGGLDERQITKKHLYKLIINNPDIQNIYFAKHPIAYPSFISRSNNKIYLFVESILSKLGLNWARIFIIRKSL
jgi:ubiquinone/menaquinone biosynthesis C-methylase UbiE